MSIDEGDRKIMKKYSLNIIQSSQVMYSLQSNQKEEILKLKKKINHKCGNSQMVDLSSVSCLERLLIIFKSTQ